MQPERFQHEVSHHGIQYEVLQTIKIWMRSKKYANIIRKRRNFK